MVWRRIRGVAGRLVCCCPCRRSSDRLHRSLFRAIRCAWKDRINSFRVSVFINWTSNNPELTNARRSFWHFRLDAHSEMKMEGLTNYMAKDCHSEGLPDQPERRCGAASPPWRNTCLRPGPFVTSASLNRCRAVKSSSSGTGERRCNSVTVDPQGPARGGSTTKYRPLAISDNGNTIPILLGNSDCTAALVPSMPSIGKGAT